MKFIRNSIELTSILSSISGTIGFVPTMGCLHAGHLSLIEKSKLACDTTVCSIFVNPTQFNDPEDFKKYPSTLEADMALLSDQNCDYLFLPSQNEMYPADHLTKNYSLGYLENILEGEYRPGHFQGVCQAVDRLLEIVPATDLWLGRKDLQQCMVIKRLLEITNRQKINLHLGETVREHSGLALSSRNNRLSLDGKQKAPALYQSLVFIKENYLNNNIQDLEATAKENLIKTGFDKIDYLTIVESESLLPAEKYTPEKNYTVIAAAWLEGVRLIDNLNVN